jgi:hypothetical protein
MIAPSDGVSQISKEGESFRNQNMMKNFIKPNGGLIAGGNSSETMSAERLNKRSHNIFLANSGVKQGDCTMPKANRP